MDTKEALKVYFGYESFREGQESIINTILAGRDSLAIMPTGSGKSICYQIPALILPGITIVINRKKNRPEVPEHRGQRRKITGWMRSINPV